MRANLRDLEMELWLRRRKNLTWVTRDGKQIAIEDLTEDHLKNIIAMIRRDNSVSDLIGDGPDWDSDNCIL